MNLLIKSAAMKRMISLIAIVSILSLTCFAKAPVAKGKTHSSLGNYVVENAVNPIVVDGKELKTYVVSYENSDMTVRVGIDKSSKTCTKYIVVSDELTVQYECNKRVFGVKKVDKEYQNDGFVTTDLNLNKSEYFHQKVLTQLEMTDLEHVTLISVYYPKLVKDYENVFAVK